MIRTDGFISDRERDALLDASETPAERAAMARRAVRDAKRRSADLAELERLEAEAARLNTIAAEYAARR